MLTCPHCNSSLNLEQLTEDAAARQFFGMVAQSGYGIHLVAYINLFKPRKQALRWSRALSLVEELQARVGVDPRLGLAMARTVESLREKRQEHTWRPLTNHNYLVQVLESTPAMHAPVGRKAIPDKTRDRSLSDDLGDTSWAD